MSDNINGSEPPSPNGENGYLISALAKAGLKNYREVFDSGKLKYTTVKLYIPTGIVPVDHILGGGFPAGRISEVYGPEAVYKSGLSQMALEYCLYMGGVGLMYDNEETFDERRSALPNLPGFIYDISKDMEEFFASLKKNLTIVTGLKDAISVALWDSLPATLPKLILESDEGERTLGEAARIMSIEIPRCKGLIRESLCALIAVNQVRSNMSRINKYDNPYQTPGGWAPKFFATLRLILQKRGKFTWYTDSIETNGVYIEVLVEKNKNFNPFQRALFPIVYQDHRGGDPAMSYFDWATNLEEIRVANPGRWDFGAIVPGLKCHKTEFHHAYLENLDVFLDFYYGKTGFKYGDLALIGVKAITERLYAKTTEIVKGPKRVRPK
jgi:RecA/RadA recombinase